MKYLVILVLFDAVYSACSIPSNNYHYGQIYPGKESTKEQTEYNTVKYSAFLPVRIEELPIEVEISPVSEEKLFTPAHPGEDSISDKQKEKHQKTFEKEYLPPKNQHPPQIEHPPQPEHPGQPIHPYPPIYSKPTYQTPQQVHPTLSQYPQDPPQDLHPPPPSHPPQGLHPPQPSHPPQGLTQPQPSYPPQIIHPPQPSHPPQAIHPQPSHPPQVIHSPQPSHPPQVIHLTQPSQPSNVPHPQQPSNPQQELHSPHPSQPSNSPQSSHPPHLSFSPPTLPSSQPPHPPQDQHLPQPSPPAHSPQPEYPHHSPSIGIPNREQPPCDQYDEEQTLREFLEFQKQYRLHKQLEYQKKQQYDYQQNKNKEFNYNQHSNKQPYHPPQNHQQHNFQEHNVQQQHSQHHIPQQYHPVNPGYHQQQTVHEKGYVTYSYVPPSPIIPIKEGHELHLNLQPPSQQSLQQFHPIQGHFTEVTHLEKYTKPPKMSTVYFVFLEKPEPAPVHEFTDHIQPEPPARLRLPVTGSNISSKKSQDLIIKENLSYPKVQTNTYILPADPEDLSPEQLKVISLPVHLKNHKHPPISAQYFTRIYPALPFSDDDRFENRTTRD